MSKQKRFLEHKKALEERIRLARKYKKSVHTKYREIVKLYELRRIDSVQYQKKILALLGDKSISQWDKLYDDYISNCERQIAFYEKELREKSFRGFVFKWGPLIAFVILFIALILYSFINQEVLFAPPIEQSLRVGAEFFDGDIFEFDSSDLEALFVSGAFTLDDGDLFEIYLVNDDGEEGLVLSSALTREASVSLSPEEEIQEPLDEDLTQEDVAEEDEPIGADNTNGIVDLLEPADEVLPEETDSEDVVEENEEDFEDASEDLKEEEIVVEEPEIIEEKLIFDFSGFCAQTCEAINFDGPYRLEFRGQGNVRLDEIVYLEREVILRDSVVDLEKGAKVSEKAASRLNYDETKKAKGKEVVFSTKLGVDEDGPGLQNVKVEIPIDRNWNIKSASSLQVLQNGESIDFDVIIEEGIVIALTGIEIEHFSEQVFEIIVITDAEHLNSEREFISDIFEEVKERDDLWSGEIDNGEYVRVTFEIPLDSNRDITVWPRTISGNPRIEIYEKDGNEIIAEFESLNENQYNKVFLTGLTGEQDVFDLRIIDGSLEFDHIIDPSSTTLDVTTDYKTPLNPFLDIDNDFVHVPIQENLNSPYDDLHAYFGFDVDGGGGPSTAYDFSSNELDASYEGGASTTGEGAGIFGRGALFDGVNGDYIELPNENYNDYAGNDLTITAWIKIQGSGPSNEQHIVTRWDGSTDEQFAFYFNDNDNKLYFVVNSNAACAGTFDSFSSSSTLSNHEWYFVAAVLDDNSEKKIYVVDDQGWPSGSPDWDARTTSNVVIPGDCATTSWPTAIGARSRDGGTRPFEGIIDEVMIFDHELTDNELEAIYDETAKRFWTASAYQDFEGIQMGANDDSLEVSLDEYLYLSGVGFDVQFDWDEDGDYGTVPNETTTYPLLDQLDGTLKSNEIDMKALDMNGDNAFRMRLNYNVDSEGFFTPLARGNPGNLVLSASVGPDTIPPTIDFREPPTPESDKSLNEDNFLVEWGSSDDKIEHYSFLNFSGDLMFWMPMDEWSGTCASGHNVSDLSGQGWNSTLLGNVCIDEANGRFGSGLHVDPDGGNNDYLSGYDQDGAGGDQTGIIGGGDVSISVWAKWSGAPITGDSYIMGRGIGCQNGTAHLFIDDSNSEKVSFRIGTKTQCGGSASTAVADASIDNEWHHYVGVRNSSGVYLFIDGVLQSTSGAAIDFRPHDENQDFGIGSQSGASGNSPWNGSIDEVLIFNRSLQFAEVNALFDSSEGLISFQEDPGLEARLNMDSANSSGDPIDTTANNHDGTLQGDATIIESGKFNKGASFNASDGTDWIELASTDGSFTDITLSAWARWDGGTPSDHANILSRQKPGNNAGDVGLWLSDGTGTNDRISFTVETNSNANSATANLLITDEYFSGWHHYVGVRNSSGVYLFIDGVLQDDDGPVTTIGTGDVNFFVGAGANGFDQGDDGWIGGIDEVMIFDRALSEAEVQQLFESEAIEYRGNFTELSDADYEYIGWAVDSAGNRATTNFRTTTIDTDDLDVNYLLKTPNNLDVINDPLTINLRTFDSNVDRYSIVDFNQSLKLWMRFDEVNPSGSLLDLSGNGNNGTLISGTSRHTNGKFGEAVNFDGLNDYVLIPTSPSLNISGKEITLASWVRWEGPTDNSSIDEFQTVISKGGYGDGFRLVVDGNGTGLGTLRFQLRGETHTLASTGALTQNKWHHLIALYNGTNMAIYIDGLLDSTLAKTNDIDTSIRDLWIGHTSNIGYPDAFRYPFMGDIDEVMIFDRALSEEEIRSLYDTDINLFWHDPDLIFRMDMDRADSLGNPIDTSGNGNNGTLNGDAILELEGRYGKKVSLDGVNDNVLINDNSILDLGTSDFTISAWVNSTQEPMLVYWPMILSKEGGSPRDGFNLVLHNGLFPGWFGQIFINGNNYNTLSGCFACTDIADGTWHHLTFIREGNTLKGYEDGVLVSTSTNVAYSGDISNDLDLRIGEFNDGNYDLDGDVDEVNIFDRALNDSEVMELYLRNVNEYNHDMTGLSDGNYTFVGRVVDLAGNVLSEILRIVTIDNTHPEVRFLDGSTTPSGSTPLNGSSIGATITVEMESSDSYDHYSFVDFDKSLKLWMRFDDVNGKGDPVDLTDFVNNATLQGSAFIDTAGRFGETVNLDGSSGHVRVEHSDSLNISDEITISLWFNRTADVDSQRLIGKYYWDGSHTGSWYMDIAGGGNDDKVSCYMDIGGSWISAHSLNTVSLGEWTFASCVYNGTDINVYKNDDSPGVTSASGSLANSTFPLMVGDTGNANGLNNTNYFTGDIDEVMIFDRALSEEEISSLYDSAINQYTNVFETTNSNHTFIGFAVDMAGNVNFTDERIVFGDGPPKILNISGLPATLIPDEGICKDINYTVLIEDSGLNDNPNEIVNVSARFARDGSIVRHGVCSEIACGGCSNVQRNYTCEVDLCYFDEPHIIIGWQAVANVTDDDDMFSQLGKIFTVASVYFYEIDSLLQWSNLPLGGADVVADGSPFEIRNKGNEEFSDINLTATNLYANHTEVGTQGILRHYRFNDGLVSFGNATTADSSGALNSLTAKCDHDFSVPGGECPDDNETNGDLIKGRYGGGFRFNGENGVSVEDRIDLGNFDITRGDDGTTATNETTIMVWARWDAGDRSDSRLISKALDPQISGADDEHIFMVSRLNSAFRFRVKSLCPDGTEDTTVLVDGGTGLANDVDGSQNTTLTSGVWFHIAAIYDANAPTNEKIRLYYDGDLIAHKDPDSSGGLCNGNLSMDSSWPVYIGDQPGESRTNDRTWNGLIDEVMIFDRALSEEEIEFYMAGGWNLSAYDISVNANTASCNGDLAQDFSPVTLSTRNPALDVGDNSIGEGTADLQFCFENVPDSLPIVDYRAIYGENVWDLLLFNWILRMFGFVSLLAAVKTRKRKKKLLEEDDLLLVLEEKLEEKYGIGLDELVGKIRKRSLKGREVYDEGIPIDVFRTKVGPAEALTKYLKENKGLGFSEIARILRRDDRTVWINYRNALKKMKGKVRIGKGIRIPVNVLANRKLSVLENVVVYLKDKGIRNIEIGELLDRDSKIIWTLYDRAKRKLG